MDVLGIHSCGPPYGTCFLVYERSGIYDDDVDRIQELVERVGVVPYPAESNRRRTPLHDERLRSSHPGVRCACTLKRDTGHGDWA